MSRKNKTIEMHVLNTTISVMANDQNEELIREISDIVKKKLEALKERNPRTNPMQIAILGCMNMTEQVFDERQKNQDVKTAVKMLDERNLVLSDELQTAKDACQVLMAEVDQLQVSEKELKAQLTEQEELLSQYREKLERATQEVEYGRKSVVDLQNQLFETQIELSRWKQD